MKHHGIRIRLEPDSRIPAFMRLRHELVEIPLADILTKGIHPEPAMGGTGDWCQAAELLALKLNKSDMRFAALSPHHLNHEILTVRDGFHQLGKQTALVRTLEQIETGTYFTDRAGYDRIVGLAAEWLEGRWNNGKARELLRGGRNGFNEQRAFLKAKHPRLKIGSYEALEALDLAALLSVGDFMAEERNIANQGLTCRNFRKPGAILGLLDADGFLRFRERIEWFEAVIHPQQQFSSGHVKYACQLDGDRVLFKPELTQNLQQRGTAAAFARQYRSEGGDYCFSMPVERVEEALEQVGAEVKFTNTRYLERTAPLVTGARFRKEGLVRYGIPWRKIETGEEFRSALRAHGRKVSGNKGELLRRTAELAGELHAEAKVELDDWFGAHRFVRVPGNTTFPKPFPVCDGTPLGKLVLMVYLMRRLRGNTVVDTEHENTSVLPADMAEAILQGKASLTGCFIET